MSECSLMNGLASRGADRAPAPKQKCMAYMYGDELYPAHISIRRTLLEVWKTPFQKPKIPETTCMLIRHGECGSNPVERLRKLMATDMVR